jgi:three-Cys-motif partner protein
VPPKSTVWTPEPHTLAKHDLLKRYLGAWFPIMARNNSKLVFLDGFAGPGVYDTGEPGSPLVAIRSLIDHRYFENMSGTKFMFLFVEADGRRVESLEEEIEKFWASIGDKPTNVSVEVVEGEFGDLATTIIEDFRARGTQLAPTLAFVDPFGFKGVALDTICELTKFARCEVIFSFMYDGLNRWITHPEESIHVSLRDLFGTDEYEDGGDLSGEQRRRFLHDLYMDQLMDAGKFKYALDFEMVNMQGRNVYSLIFATRHIAGLEAMKEAMWDVDPSGGFRFSDRHAGTTSLFNGHIDPAPLRQAMLKRFAGKEVRVDTEIHEFVLADTIYGPTHYKKQVLKPLQEEGLLIPISGQRRKGTFPDGTVVRFAK